eukprot:350210-Chlamydomonas_euryale.AAC.2
MSYIKLSHSPPKKPSASLSIPRQTPNPSADPYAANQCQQKKPRQSFNPAQTIDPTMVTPPMVTPLAPLAAAAQSHGSARARERAPRQQQRAPASVPGWARTCACTAWRRGAPPGGGPEEVWQVWESNMSEGQAAVGMCMQGRCGIQTPSRQTVLGVAGVNMCEVPACVATGVYVGKLSVCGYLGEDVDGRGRGCEFHFSGRAVSECVSLVSAELPSPRACTSVAQSAWMVATGMWPARLLPKQRATPSVHHA